MSSNQSASSEHHSVWHLTRRHFLRTSTAMAAALASGAAWAEEAPPVILRFGIVTDPHFVDGESRGTRHYRESLGKMTECVAFMNEQQVDFLIELGDMTDMGEPGDTSHLERIEAVLAQFKGPRYHVVGNHDFDSLSKPAFQSVVENTGIPRERTYYSFDRGGVHVVVLDACFLEDGTPYDTGNFGWTETYIPADQLAWLDADLAATDLPVIMCVHQLLDGDTGGLIVRNAAEVRAALEKRARVLTVFQGHHHAGQFNRISGIPYYTLKGMVEGSGEAENAYAIVEVYGDDSVAITGYRKAVSMAFPGE